MKYTMTSPCEKCPFLKSMARGFPMQRLREFASGQFACHQTCEIAEDDKEGSTFQPGENSVHCAGALIFLEKREQPNQMMRICERLEMYDRTKLNMDAPVR